MRTHALIGSFSTTLWLLAGAGCHEPSREERPLVTVWLAGDAEPDDTEPGPLCALVGVAEHQGVHVKHQLPAYVETDDPVVITAETPCDTQTSSMVHDVDGLAEATVEAPRGASCRLTIRVEIANDLQICSSPEGACGDLAALCHDPP